MEDQIKQDLKQAQLNRDELKVSTLRMLSSELTNLKIQKGVESLEDADIISVVQKEVKKRKEASEGFRKGNREEQAQKEESEAKVLEGYLPTQLSDEELTKIIETSINELDATSISDMGKVISNVMSQVQGQAEGARVSGLVKEKLLTT